MTDFGIARKLQGDFVSSPVEFGEDAAPQELTRPRLARAHTKCGTRDYVAPEVMNGNGYNTQADMWSVGVVTHVVLTGYAPVYVPDINGVLCVRLDDEVWHHKSALVKDFVAKLLVRDPDHRLSAESALDHGWVSN